MRNKVGLISSSGRSAEAGEQQARLVGLRPPERRRTGAAEEARLTELVLQTAQGHDHAFATLYDQTSARVFGTTLRVLRSPHLAAEVTQDVYVEIWRKVSDYDPQKGSVLAWITTVAHRRAVDRVRAVNSELVRDDRYATSSDERPFDQVWEEVEGRIDTAQVRHALNTLTEIQREAVTLAFFDGYSQSEVAHHLQVPLGTVKTRIRAGLAGLRDALRMWT